MSITFFQFSSVNLKDKLSKVIPALLIRISNPSSFLLLYLQILQFFHVYLN